MLRIGLSGGIGSGKSTVSARLADLGAVVVDADSLAREVVRRGSPALADILARFGQQVLDDHGDLDRPALGRIVFADPAARADLEGITHPRIAHRTAELVRAAEAAGTQVLVHDVPLLVEKGMAPSYDLVVIVGAPEQERLRRLVRERGMAEQEARGRIASQAQDAARRAVADVWLDNSGDLADLEQAVDRMWHEHVLPRVGAPGRPSGG